MQAWGSSLKPRDGQASHPHGDNVLTQLAHFQDLTQHLGQLYAAAAKGTFMLVFSATVLKHNLPRTREEVREGIQWLGILKKY